MTTFYAMSSQWPIAFNTDHVLYQRCASKTPITKVAQWVSRVSRGLHHSQQQTTQSTRQRRTRCEAGKSNGWPDWLSGEGWPGSMLRAPGTLPRDPAGSGSAKPGGRGGEPDTGAASSEQAAHSSAREQPPDDGWQQNWEGWEQDWDDWDSSGPREAEPTSKRQRYKRMASRRGPRDAYLRPMIDSEGIRQRLTWDAAKGEDALRTEFEVNQFESREAVTFAGERPDSCEP